MANLSQEKRLRMLNFLDTIKDEHKEDDEVLKAIYEIENELVSKKYGLVWEKHEENVDVQMRTHIPVFTEVKDKEIVADKDNLNFNFLLEGDNLHSLKLLEKTHNGKIDVIYIDPPYNTKKEGFTYSDTLVDGNDTFRHSKWISFMAERLKVAQKLLSCQGVIFISIDENEFAQLKMLCDEVFGENNFIESIIWNKRVPKNDKGIGNIHEYILLYSKCSDFKYKFMMAKDGMDDIIKLMDDCKRKKIPINETEEKLKQLYKKKAYDRAITLYNSVDNDYRIWGKINMSWPNGNTFGPRYDVLHPKTNKPVKVPDRGWRWSEETFNQAVDYNNVVERYDGSYMCGGIWFSKNEGMQPSSIKYLDEVDRMLLRSIISLKSDGSIELEKYFGEKSVFAYPKPVTLMKVLIDSITYNNPNAIILDFFAGSGTTAQAVLELNKELNSKLKYILCTNNEKGICENVTYSRIQKVINGYEGVEGIPANLKYYKTDFIPKMQDGDNHSISDYLLNHIKEMVQLEQGIRIDKEKYHIILTDEDADRMEAEWGRYTNCKVIYISKNVLLTASQNKLFSNVDIKTIPDYYFENELREVGEIW